MLHLVGLASLLVLLLSLLSIYFQLLLPQLFDVSLVLLFSHSSLLCIHLLQTLVLRELLGHLNLKFFFHFALFFEPDCFQLNLVILCSLQLLLHSLFLGSLVSLLSSKSLLHLLDLQVVPQVFYVLLLCASLCLLLSKLAEYGFSLCLGCLLHGLEIVGSLLLLGCKLTNEFLLVFF